MPDMTDRETAEHIRQWAEKQQAGKVSHFSWPTDGCGYGQHIKFVRHRNENWKGSTATEFRQFALDYAAGLGG